MTSCDDPEFTVVDDHIRTQLAEAAGTYGSQVDLDARLKAVLEAEELEG
jgi:hypothetical protein